MRDLLIVEPGHGGHRMRYVARIVRGAVDRGLRVTAVVTPEGARHPEMSGLPEGVEVIDLPLPQYDGRSLLRFQLIGLRTNRRLAGAYPSARTLVPFGDNVDKAVAVFGPGRGAWALLLMRAFFHHAPMGVVGASGGRSDKAREWLFRWLLLRKGVARILTIDELLPRYVRERDWKGGQKVRFVPDPPHVAPPADREASRRRWMLPDGASTVLVYGALHLRKGLDDLVKAVAGDPAKAWRLLLVGEQDEEVRALLASRDADALRREERLVEADRYVDEADEAAAFAAADAVWLGYRDFQGSSGVLVQAARADRPVVACPEGLIGWRTATHGLGATLKSREPEDVLRALSEALAEGANDEAAGRRARFAEANSEAAFLDAVLGS